MTRSKRWPFRSKAPLFSLTQIRSSLNLTQAELARKVRVSRVTIARWEGGATRPRRGDLNRLLGFLTDELVTLAVESARAARKEEVRTGAQQLTDAEFCAQYKTDVRGTIELLVRATMELGETRMSLSEWRRVLHAEPKLFAGVPIVAGDDGGPAYLGSDVGFALWAAARGMTYSEFVARSEPSDEWDETRRVFGNYRLHNEILYRWDLLGMVSSGTPLVESEARRPAPEGWPTR